MNRKQFFILLALVVVLGAVGLNLYRQNSRSWQSAGQGIGQKLMGDLPVNDVALIQIKSGTNELNLVKQDNRWRVKERGDYPANFGEISGFLLKAVDLKAAQSEELGPSQLGRFKLLPPGPATNTGVLVELKDASGKLLKSLLLGKPHLHKGQSPSPMGEGGDEGWPDGRYVMVGTGAKTVAVVSDPMSNLEPKPDQWLNKDFIKVEKIRSIAVEFPVATNSWKASRDTETATEWKLADAKPEEKLDSTKTSGLSYALASPMFNDVLPAGTPLAQTGLDKPTTITLNTFDNFAYTLKVGTKTNENLPVLVSVTADVPKERIAGKDEKPDEKTRLDKEFQDKLKKWQEKLAQEQAFSQWTYLVPSYTLDALLKERSQLLVEKKEDKPAGTSTEPPKPEGK